MPASRVYVPDLAFQAQILAADVQQQFQLDPRLSYVFCHQIPPVLRDSFSAVLA